MTQWDWMQPHMGGWGAAGTGFMMVGMVLWTLIGVALLVALVVWLGRAAGTRPVEFMAGMPERDPLHILEARYARGELTDEEFERMRSRLQRREPTNRA